MLHKHASVALADIGMGLKSSNEGILTKFL